MVKALNITVGILLALSVATPAVAQKTKAQLTTEVGTTFPDQTTGQITPSGVRAFQNDVINSIMPTAPVGNGNLACFDGTTGLLRDCGAAPSTVPLTVGTTPIVGGVENCVLYKFVGAVACSLTPPITLSNSTVSGNLSTANLNSGTNASSATYWRGDGTWSAPATGCVRMWPSSNQTNAAAWNLVDAYGNAISTAGTTTQGLQEGINYSVNNGQCMQVFGQGIKQIFRGSGFTHTSTTIDGLSSTSNMLVGDYVTGTGVQAFTQITNILSSTSIQVNNVTTASATVTITVTRGAGVNLQNYISATSTVTIPPFEQWSFDAYGVNLTFASSVNGSGLQFGSGIIGHFGWWGGQVVYQAGTPTPASCAVSIAPNAAVPLDGIPAFGDNDIFISNIAAPSASSAGQGVWCVSLANGSVVNNHFGSNEINGTGVGATPNATYGFIVANAQANTSFKGNKISFVDVHLVASSGIQIGTSATNQTNYSDNEVYANVSPGLASTCFSSYGSNSKFRGSCRNDQAGGNVSQGINFQSGANNNTFDISYTTSGVTTPLSDSGSNNSGFLNGLLKSTNGWISAKRLNAIANPVSALPSCGSASAPEGSMASVTDANSNAWGAGVAGGGANHVLAYCNGTGWTIAGK